MSTDFDKALQTIIFHFSFGADMGEVENCLFTRCQVYLWCLGLILPQETVIIILHLMLNDAHDIKI